MKYFDEIHEILFRFEKLGIEKSENGTVLIGKAPHIAEFAWLHSIYKTLSEEEVFELEKNIKTQLPNSYRDFLLIIVMDLVFLCQSFHYMV